MLQKDKLRKTLTKRLVTYATGREIQPFEHTDIDKISEGKDKFKDILVAVIKSELFQRK